jgi:P27 family predicted phage terminase small subunit
MAFWLAARSEQKIMGLRGAAPKPTVIEVAEGRPGKRPLNGNEPDFDHVIPECPEHLNDEARKKWDQLAPILHRARLLTEGDQIALANLCQAYATMANAQRMLNKTSIVFTTPSGYIQQSPLFSVITTSMELINKLCREFGLTPSARSRLSVGNAEKEPDLLDDAIFGRGSQLLVLPKRG